MLRSIECPLGGVTRGLVLDVLDFKHIDEKVTAASTLFSEHRIDILVCAFGVIDHARFLDVSERDFDNVMNVNVKGTYFLCQSVARLMIEQNVRGHILLLSSASALRPASTPYILSKWAIKGLTLGLADQLIRENIVVNAVAPGPVATSMLGRDESDSLYKPDQPMGRYSTPEEIANIALLLVSDYGNLIIGDSIYATGGSGILSLHK